MKFKVSSKIKGSLVLKTIGRPIKGGQIIFIEENGIYAEDVQIAIKKGLLISQYDSNAGESILNNSQKVLIVNRTEKVLILNKNISLKPYGSVLKERKDLNIDYIKRAIKNGYITVISDLEDFENIDEEVGVKAASVIDDKTEETNSSTWDFREQTLKTAKTVSKAEIKRVDVNEGEDDEALNKMIDTEDEKVSKKKTSKNGSKKKVAKKKSSKKKEKQTVKKNSSIKPVGNKKETNIAIELDSQGNQLVSEVLTDLIDKTEERLSFVDDEQSEQRKKERNLD